MAPLQPLFWGGIFVLSVAFNAPVSSEVDVSHSASHDLETVDTQDALPDSWGVNGAQPSTRNQ